VTHWIVPSAECRLTTSVCSAMVTIVESRIAAIPPTISASKAFRTAGVSFAVSAARSTVVVSATSSSSARYQIVS
jgi:hypothetical protein